MALHIVGDEAYHCLGMNRICWTYRYLRDIIGTWFVCAAAGNGGEQLEDQPIEGESYIDDLTNQSIQDDGLEGVLLPPEQAQVGVCFLSLK